MITIQRILCPTDLTMESDEALRYAVALSSVYNAKLFILYCREPGTNRNGNGGNAQSVETEPLFIESLAPHLGLKSVSELNWEGLVAENAGDVGKTIVHEAAKHEVDLIVMRSRRRPHAASLLGSTAETVSRTARCSVLVTHPQEREWVSFSTGEIDLNRILVAHDFSADSELALKYGVSLGLLTDGMVISTHTPALENERRMLLKMLAQDHPGDGLQKTPEKPFYRYARAYDEVSISQSRDQSSSRSIREESRIQSYRCAD